MTDPLNASQVETKITLRAAMLAKRNQLLPVTQAEHSTTIANLVLQLPWVQAAATIGCYVSINSEVQTNLLLSTLLAWGCQVVLPRIVGRQLTLHRITDLASLVSGPLGILQPPAHAPLIEPDAVNVMLVPGVVFDAYGNRLGYGAGYYDRMLSQSHAKRIALAYTCQLVPAIPAESHDGPMDLIVTECGVIHCQQARETPDHLRLRNLQCIGYHGVYPEEREYGVRFTVNIDARMDLQTAILTDNLDMTVDYPRMVALIQQVQAQRQYYLLEALTGEIAHSILDTFPIIREVTVTVNKSHPPVEDIIDAFEVGVTITRTR